MQGLRAGGTDSVKVMQVIETTAIRGSGADEDPGRPVKQYWDFDGNLLVERDPYIIQMVDCYKRPNLCNYYCSHKCTIGDRYVPEVEVSELSNIILETIARLNEINPLTCRLIQIARDGKITDDEVKGFVRISKNSTKCLWLSTH